MTGVQTCALPIYHDVLDELESAGPAGATPVEIAKRSGHDLTDVHTMLGFLYDDGRAAIIEGGPTQSVRYTIMES